MARVMVGIPTYNEEATIHGVVEASYKHADVVLVGDDGSKDNTVRLAREAGATVVAKARNEGYGSALATIFEEARKRIPRFLVILDGDGQHDPSEIQLFLEGLENAHVAIGNRYLAKGRLPLYRRMGLWLVNKLSGVGDAQCGFRAFDWKAYSSIQLNEKGMAASLQILRQIKENGLAMVEVPCTVKYDGTSHSQNPVSHGFSLMETLVWNTIWRHPFLYLGVPAVLFLSVGLFSGAWMALVWSVAREIPLSLAVLSLGGLIIGFMSGVTSIIVWSIKRGLMER